MLRSSLVLLALALALGACGGNEPTDTEDTGTPGDTGPTYEEGCITVDGTGGYAYLADALTVAEGGSVISLCAPVEEAVVVDKAVTIVGTGDTLWIPPTNEPAAKVVEGGDLTISGVRVETTRTGFEAEDGRLSLSNVSIDEVGTYGIDAKDSELELERVTIIGAPWGGVQTDGGSLVMRSSAVDGAFAYGLAMDGTEAELIDSQVVHTMYTGDGTEVSDGWAMTAHGGSLRLAGVEMVGNILGGVEALSTTLEVEDSTVHSSYFGIWIENTVATVTDTHVNLPLQYGMVVLGSRDVTLDGVDITTDPENSAMQTEDGDGSMGVIGVDSDLVIQGGLVSGNNGAGVYLTNANSTEVSLTMSDTVVDDNARFGVVTFNGTMEITDVVVSNTRNDDLCLAEDGGYACNMGLTAWVSDMTVRGGAVLDNEMWGLAALLGSVDVEGTTFSGNEEFGLFAQQAALTVSEADFDGGGQYGLYLYESNGVVQDSLFHNADHVSSSEYEDGEGRLIEYYNWYRAQDIYAYMGSLVVQDCTFEHGQQGISSYSTELEVENSTFTDYNQQALYYYGAGGNKLVATDVSIDGIGGYAVQCSSGKIELDRVTISDVNSIANRYESYADGELQYSSDYTYVTNAIYGYQCDLAMEDVIIEEVQGPTIYMYGGSAASLEMDGVVLRDLGSSASTSRGAIYMDYSQATPDVWLNDVEISQVHNGHAFEIYGPTDSSYAGGLVQLHDLSLGGGGEDTIQGSGLYLSRVDNLTVAGLEIAGTGGSGIYLDDAEGELIGISSSLDGSITGPGTYGLYASESVLVVSDMAISGSGASGIYASGGEVQLSDVSVTGAGGYGLECANDATVLAFDSSFEGSSGSSSGCVD